MPENLKGKFGHEVCVSLKTPYRAEALRLSGVIYSNTVKMLDDPMIDYKELRRRINADIQDNLVEVSTDVNSKPVFSITSQMQAEHPDYSYEDFIRQTVVDYLNNIKKEDSIKRASQKIIPEMIDCNIIKSDEIVHFSEEDKLIATKAYLEGRITFYTALLKRTQGDFTFENNMIMQDFRLINEIPKEIIISDEKIAELEYLNNHVKDLFDEDRIFGITQAEIDEILEHVYTSKPIFGHSEANNCGQGSDTFTINDLNNKVSEEQSDTKMLYSEAKDKYIDNKVKENRWKPHLVPERKFRLELFITVMGDKPLSIVNRDIIREYRDKLLKLPLNFTRKAEFKGKSIDEIINSNDSKVISLTRVNYFIQELSSLFDWCLAEGLISANPVKKLQIKDVRKEIEIKSAFEVKDLQVLFSSEIFIEKEQSIQHFFGYR
jgi:hypothetical protein